MCGRYSLSISPETIAALFNFYPGVETIPPRFNIAPTQSAPVVRLDRDGNRQLASLRWGLVPRWSKDLASGSKMINARSETVAEKPAFRDAFRKRRCLVPVSGFYEWQKLDARTKQPYYIHHHDGQPLVMAGLWESWKQNDESQPIETFTILTTEANLTMQFLHDRMPVILQPEQFADWLRSDDTDIQSIQDSLKPAEESLLVMHAVSRRVNSPADDDAGLIEPESTVPQIREAEPVERFRQKSLFD
jgi:putative SOS response-associated peptidase YedK